MSDYLKIPPVVALRAVILKQLLAHPPSGDGLFCLGSWMARHLSQKDFDHLDLLEGAVGPRVANEWLSEILVESKQYKDAGNGYVTMADIKADLRAQLKRGS